MNSTPRLHGLAALNALFEVASAQNRAAFMPYWSIGYPNYAASLDALRRLAALDVDAFEIGVPFSDPIADGVMIQATTQIALEQGTTVKHCLRAVATLRGEGVRQPMMMMSYLNPLVAYGTTRFVEDAYAAGADGLIVPDLPPEEAPLFAEACQQKGMALVFFLAPTSSDERIATVAAQASGFIYTVAQVGITGARDLLSDELPEFIARIRRSTAMPLVLGFGISKPAHVRVINPLVNGYIVASALLREHQQHGMDAMQTLAGALRAAAHHSSE